MNGLRWHVDQAQVQDCGSFQDRDTGEARAWAKLAYFGGMASLKISMEDLKKIEAHRGKMVEASGRLEFEVKKGSGDQKINFCLDEIKPVK